MPVGLPDTYPVDEHVCRISPWSRVAATGTRDRKIQDRKHRVAGLVEMPVRERIRRNTEVRLRAVGVVLPEAHACVIPLASPRVPRVVDGNPVAHVFTADHGVVISHVPGGPAAGGETVQLYPRFPGVADASPPVPEELAAVVGVAVLCGVEDEVGLTVDEHVSAIVAVLPDIFG